MSDLTDANITVTDHAHGTENHYDSMGEVSDGYHTFNELYAHRITLFIALCQMVPEMAWRSKNHAQGGDKMYEGWFIAGIELPTGNINYHLPLSDWDRLESIKELQNAPAWDGADAAEHLTRLSDYSSQLALENAEAA
jgi:hypothetical protein